MQTDETEFPAAIRLSVGEHWQFRLPGLGAAGYQWCWELEGDQDIVVVTITPLLPEMSSIRGDGTPEAGSYLECLDVYAQHPGSAVLRLVQRRPWEKDKPPVRAYQLSVTVE